MLSTINPKHGLECFEINHTFKIRLENHRCHMFMHKRVRKCRRDSELSLRMYSTHAQPLSINLVITSVDVPNATMHIHTKRIFRIHLPTNPHSIHLNKIQYPHPPTMFDMKMVLHTYNTPPPSSVRRP